MTLSPLPLHRRQSFFNRPGPGAQQGINPQQIEMAETELSMISDIFDRLVRSCHTKCISDSYREGELNKGEGVCVDRSVPVLNSTSRAASSCFRPTELTLSLISSYPPAFRTFLHLPGLVTRLFDGAHFFPASAHLSHVNFHLVLLGSRPSNTYRHHTRTSNTCVPNISLNPSSTSIHSHAFNPVPPLSTPFPLPSTLLLTPFSNPPPDVWPSSLRSTPRSGSACRRWVVRLSRVERSGNRGRGPTKRNQ